MGFKKFKKGLTKTVNKTVNNPVAAIKSVAKVAPVAAVISKASAVSNAVIGKPNSNEKKLRDEIDEKNKRIRDLENSLNLSKDSLKLSTDEINQRMEEINRLEEQRNTMTNTLKRVYKKKALLDDQHEDIIYKTYAPLNESQMKSFEDNIAKVVEGFTIKIPRDPRQWGKKPKNNSKSGRAVAVAEIDGGSKTKNMYSDAVISTLTTTNAILSRELANNKAAFQMYDTTNLTGIPYKYAVTANQNQLIDNQISTNKDIYRTDMRKTDYKTNKIQWLEYINKFLFYTYYLIAFYCIFKVVLSTQPIIVRVIIVACIFIYPLIIGRLERGLIFVYTFIKSFLLGDAIDTVETPVSPDSITS